jgi:hypothetical protein
MCVYVCVYSNAWPSDRPRPATNDNVSCTYVCIMYVPIVYPISSVTPRINVILLMIVDSPVTTGRLRNDLIR